MILRHCSGCACPISADEWIALPCVGVQSFEEGLSLDLRTHRCGTTIAVVLRPVPLEIHEYLEGREGRAA